MKMNEIRTLRSGIDRNEKVWYRASEQMFYLRTKKRA